MLPVPRHRGTGTVGCMPPIAPRTRRTVLWLAAVCTAIGMAYPTVSASPTKSPQVSAASVLAGLTVSAEYASSPYRRAAFQHWVDADSDCQHTRIEVLVRDALEAPTRTTTSCTVSAGTWTSWLDGATVSDPRRLDVDHLVALAEAWRSGAYAWDAARRRAFANDLGFEWSLRPVSSGVNRAKSDKDPARWLPPDPSTHCAYATRWVLVKYRWQLSVDRNELAALRGVLSGTCGTAPVQLPPRAAG